MFCTTRCEYLPLHLSTVERPSAVLQVRREADRRSWTL
jgi:hypothetical protein